MKKEMLNAEVATEKKTPCSFRFHSVYSKWLIVRGILGILGFVFGIAVLFNFSKLENKAALTIIVPTMFGLFCAIAAFITSGKLRKRSGYIANVTMLVMDTVFAGMLGGKVRKCFHKHLVLFQAGLYDHLADKAGVAGGHQPGLAHHGAGDMIFHKETARHAVHIGIAAQKNR